MHAPGNSCAEKARERTKHSLMLSEEKLALGQFKTLTKQEFYTVETATQCYLAIYRVHT